MIKKKSISRIMIKISASVLITTLLFGVFSCKKEEAEKKKELLIYCGITMIDPMTEIATIIEKEQDCLITITKGGSGNLLESIVYNQTGDLYLPGSDRYFTTIESDYPGLVLDTVSVGHNRAVIMVQKGNPYNITGDLLSLASADYGVIIGHPDSGSIGKETKKILDKRGIYEDVVKNVMSLTTDSKDLIKAIISKDADIVINWFAASTWNDNSDYVDVIEINPEFVITNKLVLGLLTYSEHKDIAMEVMKLAASDKGKAIFKKYGLYFE
jgi:molybdate transport system substrate-binding protein